MDLLTYPMFTYGLSIITLLLICRNQGWKKHVNYVVASGIAWGLGYAIMWIGKWIFTWIFSNGNIIREAMEKILYRTSMVGEGLEDLNPISVVFKNISVLMKWPYLLLLLIIIGGLYLLREKCGAKKQWENIIPYAIIVIVPIFWLVVKANHSYAHYWFTFRELSITIMAIIVGIMESLINIEQR